ncbi:hypothetical protein LTR36_002800 [Oleoguttula mirabilis]|uniref:F-box domain-containing protein n=1 Tax=Oleoguttula mirabilis TaxID=1507867 RepID=A0AAV9JJQ0_9PEZI|nr:hypothetical protein LTR36_002800 [Oleoguttula mirabilis]
MAASATARVLNTVELLEDILLHLPVKDLLCLAPRICKQWHALCHDSIGVRRAVFLEELPTTSRPVRFNPLFEKLVSNSASANPAAVAGLECARRHTLSTNPPQAVRTEGQDHVLEWLCESYADDSVDPKLLEGSTTAQELREKSRQIGNIVKTVPYGPDNEQDIDKCALTAAISYVAEFAWVHYDHSSTGWDVLLGHGEVRKISG